MNNQAPSWKKIAPALKEFRVQNLFGGEILPEDFLKVLFAHDEILLKQIPEFVYRHHQIIMMMMKEEYSLTNCVECGYYCRSIGFNWRRRFQSQNETDAWDFKQKESETTESTPETILLQPEEDDPSSSESEERKEIAKDNNDDEEYPKLKRCCKHFDPNF